MIKAGDLKHVVSIQHFVQSGKNEHLEPVGTWQDLYTGVYAEIKTLYGKEAENAHQLAATATVRIRTHYHEDITPLMRICAEDRIFQIVWINQVDQRTFEQVFLCSENLNGNASGSAPVNLTALNASNLTSGTVPLARLEDIGEDQLSEELLELIGEGGSGSQGPQGEQGDSAYQIAVANGFVGNEAAWLASLVGADGEAGLDGSDGSDGDSAYQIAVANGFIGNEAAWLASLEGSDGTNGATGSTGPAGPAPSGTGLVSVTSGVLDTPSTLSARVNADASNLRTQLALGDAATKNTGSSAGTLCAGDDSRLTNTRDPNAHKTSHQSGGSDAIKLDDLSAPDDNTDLNASTSAHGLLKKLDNNAAHYLDGQGNWATVTATAFNPSLYYGTTNSLGSTYDRGPIVPSNAIAALSTGRLSLYRIILAANTTITGISFLSGTTALSGGSNQWFGIFSLGLVPLRLTNDDTSTAWAGNAFKSLNLSSTYVIPTDGWYYLGICVVATTVPTFRGVTSSSTPTTAAPPVGGTSSTGLTNPASCPNPVAAITAANLLYAEVY